MFDDKPKSPNLDLNSTTGDGGLYFLIGALAVAVLVAGYFVIGAPGLHTNVARAPDRAVDVTVEQPRTPSAIADPTTTRH